MPELAVADLKGGMVATSQDLQVFVRAFRSAYGSEDSDNTGYSDLPDEYPEALLESAPPGGVNVYHFVGLINDSPVSIASVYCAPPYAGLYNVGTVHSARKRGLGRLLSQSAVNHAFDSGCSTVVLQTEANSPVETMYSKMGFDRAFVGEFLVIE